MEPPIRHGRKSWSWLFIVLLQLSLQYHGRAQRQWVFLDTKTASHQNLSPSLLGISTRSLKRRAKVLPPNRLIDETDYPVDESLLVQIRSTGAAIHCISRWFNAVSVEANAEQLDKIKSLNHVKRITKVAVVHRSVQDMAMTTLLQFLKKAEKESPDAAATLHRIKDSIDYGLSLTQLDKMKVPDLHAMNVTGKNVLIGMLDDGFNNYRTHNALKNIVVLGDSDFIHNIGDVNRQPWESSSQGNHGAGTLSVIGGYENGALIGAAYGASFVLAKTEMDSSGNTSDFPSEEDTYVAGLEWAERLGADIVSSSLGYKQFEDSFFLPLPYYTTSELDGRTTKVAQAASIAARKGVLVVTAMGNDGLIGGSKGGTFHADSTLDSPADADSIIAVGATSSSGILANFSSCGPTADGRIKPEVVAQGVSVYWADGATIAGFSYSSGTSLSTPLAAASAALVLSAHPELTPMQVREALLTTAEQNVQDASVPTASYPNNYYGYGFVNALNAALYYGPIFGNTASLATTDSSIILSINVASQSGLLLDSLFVQFRYSPSDFLTILYTRATSLQSQYAVNIPIPTGCTYLAGYIRALEQNGKTNTYSFSVPDSLFLSAPSEQRHVSSVSIFINDMSLTSPSSANPGPVIALFHNYPNPFTTATTISYSVPSGMSIELDVYDIIGRHIKTLFHGSASISAGVQEWDGTNDRHGRVASGVYFCRLKSSVGIRTVKLLYLK